MVPVVDWKFVSPRIHVDALVSRVIVFAGGVFGND